MMKQLWKRNLVILTVLLFVGLAVYLNWRYAENEAQDSRPAQAEDEAGQYGSGGEEAGTGAGDDAAAYFATARLTRQQARDNALSLLQEAAAEESADQETLNGVAESIQVLANYTLTEAQIENLVTAKGYTDCVAFMSDSGVSVVVDVPGGQLQSSDVAKIKDIVKGETGFSADQIKIMVAN